MILSCKWFVNETMTMQFYNLIRLNPGLKDLKTNAATTG